VSILPKYCEICGNELKDGSKYCGSCGSKIVYDEETDEDYENEISPLFYSKIGGSISIFGGGLGLIFGLILLLNFLSGETLVWYYESTGIGIFLELNLLFSFAWSIATIGFSVALLMAGLDAIQQKGWSGTLIGIIMGLFVIGPYFSITILALIGLILIALSKNEFSY
jgi:hypothetical protein